MRFHDFRSAFMASRRERLANQELPEVIAKKLADKEKRKKASDEFWAEIIFLIILVVLTLSIGSISPILGFVFFFWTCANRASQQ